MTQLQLQVLRPEARELFLRLARAPELAGLTLMGGTALALQIGHRISLDLDFARFDEPLPRRDIDQLIASLKSEGRQARLITRPDLISQFRINQGRDLLQLARDYMVDGIKLTFFCHGRTPAQRDAYNRHRQRDDERTFDLLDIDGLKLAKTLVLADRVRSRDLYDLMVLMRDHGFSVQESLSLAEEYGTNDDPEYYKAVLIGRIPLDQDDEGMQATGADITTDEIHAFFRQRIADYEIAVGERILRE